MTSMTVEELRKARAESSNAAYIAFINHISLDKLGLFCFFEGKDSPYYISRVKSVFKGNYYPINCTGKSKVLKVYELINNHREYDVYKKGFFIDRDFDPSVSNEAIYETPCYSIENLYTTKLTFSEILKSELGFLETDEDFERCISVYESLQKDFHEAATLFNAWYACLIHIRHTTGRQTGISLEGSLPKEFFTISLESISSNYDISAIKTKFPNATEVENESIERKIVEFSTQNKGQIFRGKFEIDFMLKILFALIEDSKTSKRYISKPIKYNINHNQAISQFSQYAETPDVLMDYIRKIAA